MDDHPPSRSLRLLLALVLGILVLGCGAVAAEEVRSDSEDPSAAEWSRAQRLGTTRFSADAPELAPLALNRATDEPRPCITEAVIAAPGQCAPRGSAVSATLARAPPHR